MNFSIISDKSRNMVESVARAIKLADVHQSKLPVAVLTMQGMSSAKVRHFLNNLISLLIDGKTPVKYLEVGVWKGLTFCAALCCNEVVDAIAIDDFSQFNGYIDEFTRNASKHISSKWSLLNCKFESSAKFLVGKKFNVYFYDGAHKEKDQYNAFVAMDPFLDDVFIAIIDDWNHAPVPIGTKSAFEFLDYTIVDEHILPSRWNADRDQWWNGLYVAVIKKNQR